MMIEYLSLLVALVSLVFSIYVFVQLRIERQLGAEREHKQSASNINFAFATTSDVMDTVLKVRADPRSADPAEITRFNIWLLGLMQYFDLDHSKLVGSKKKLLFEGGHCALIKSALDCESGRIFWQQHQQLFDISFRQIVNEILESDIQSPVIYGDLGIRGGT